MQPGALPASALEKLHEMLLPVPPSWMPQTVGWYLAFALALIAGGRWAFRRLQRYRSNQYRRSAVAELALIEQELKRPECWSNAASRIPTLLKRTALSAFPREEVASLSGARWLAFLDKTMGEKAFSEGEGRVLTELAYASLSQHAHLPDASIEGLLRLARRWIVMHEVGPP